MWNENVCILLVDDNTGLLRTLSAILAHKGYSVRTARDGPEAIVRVREALFDMIFMDIKMPGMDGVETYRSIKQIGAQAIVVMMTAYTVEDRIQEALEEGAYGILYKPLEIDEVLRLVDGVRERKQKAG